VETQTSRSYNSATLDADYGIYADSSVSGEGDTTITIINSGEISSSSKAIDVGENANDGDGNSTITITNTADLSAESDGIYAYADADGEDVDGPDAGGDATVTINNSGNVTVDPDGDTALEAYAYAHEGNASVTVNNSGTLDAPYGIYIYNELYEEDDTPGDNTITITNTGNITGDSDQHLRLRLQRGGRPRGRTRCHDHQQRKPHLQRRYEYLRV
jgi:hypothetical protein